MIPTRYVRGVLCILGVLCGGEAVFAQPPSISLRPFLEVTDERFLASRSFDANFGQSAQPFFGGGVDVTFHDHFFVDVTASRFKKTGDQVFVNNGQVFHLNLPMTATITPFEVSGGMRFHPRRYGWLVPYSGAGVGSYSYKQTSAFAENAENIDVRKTGFLATAGAEFRLHRWIGVAADVQYTHVPGILGNNPSVSHEFGENDLGGFAGRFKIVVGR